ncbi:MAG: ferredoxin [archaeon]
MAEKYKILVDKNKCIGCGSCVAVCEGNFEMKDGKAAAINSASDMPCNKEAAEICPVSAITIKKG